MRFCRILCLSLIAAVAVAIVSGQALALSAKDLVGTWTLLSLSGDPDGANLRGMLMFDANGRFIQVMVRSDPPRSSSTGHARAATASLGFYGTYSVAGTDLTRHIQASSAPDMTETDQKVSNLTLTGDELRWTNPSPPGSGPSTVVSWKRSP
jgi:Lipocalin-like domain